MEARAAAGGGRALPAAAPAGAGGIRADSRDPGLHPQASTAPAKTNRNFSVDMQRRVGGRRTGQKCAKLVAAELVAQCSRLHGDTKVGQSEPSAAAQQAGGLSSRGARLLNNPPVCLPCCTPLL